MVCDPIVSENFANVVMNVVALNIAYLYLAHHLIIGSRLQCQTSLEPGFWPTRHRDALDTSLLVVRDQYLHSPPLSL
jgi:hypothetical protein